MLLFYCVCSNIDTCAFKIIDSHICETETHETPHIFRHTPRSMSVINEGPEGPYLVQNLKVPKSTKNIAIGWASNPFSLPQYSIEHPTPARTPHQHPPTTFYQQATCRQKCQRSPHHFLATCPSTLPSNMC